MYISFHWLRGKRKRSVVCHRRDCSTLRFSDLLPLYHLLSIRLSAPWGQYLRTGGSSAAGFFFSRVCVMMRGCAAPHDTIPAAITSATAKLSRSVREYCPHGSASPSIFH